MNLFREHNLYLTHVVPDNHSETCRSIFCEERSIKVGFEVVYVWRCPPHSPRLRLLHQCTVVLLILEQIVIGFLRNLL